MGGAPLTDIPQCFGHSYTMYWDEDLTNGNKWLEDGSMIKIKDLATGNAYIEFW